MESREARYGSSSVGLNPLCIDAGSDTRSARGRLRCGGRRRIRRFATMESREARYGSSSVGLNLLCIDAGRRSWGTATGYVYCRRGAAQSPPEGNYAVAGGGVFAGSLRWRAARPGTAAQASGSTRWSIDAGRRSWGTGTGHVYCRRGAAQSPHEGNYAVAGGGAVAGPLTTLVAGMPAR